MIIDFIVLFFKYFNHEKPLQIIEMFIENHKILLILNKKFMTMQHFHNILIIKMEKNVNGNNKIKYP